LKQLIHPNIINLCSLIEINFTNGILFEYCPGGTIADLINSGGPIHPPKLYKYCLQILSAVEYMHQNQIAHLEIKLSNILLDAYDRIKISDFGLSQKITSSSYTEISGLNMFMPPEVWDLVEGYDRFLADIYSLGVPFYFMSQGRSPFLDCAQQDLKNLILKGDYPPPQNCDTFFALMICQMMKTNPKERPNLSELIHHPLFKTSSNPYKKHPSTLKKNSQSLFRGRYHSIQYNPQINHFSFQHTHYNIH
jgi:serine/threonine protein kinase